MPGSAPLIWSYGGGVQSAALAVAVLDGRLPGPETVIMADTGREASATWDYLDQVVGPALADAGLAVEVGPHSYATVALYSRRGSLLLPASTEGGGGKLPTYCSVEWKRRPVTRRLREMGYGPHRPVTLWLGMSTDELDRMRASDTRWIAHAFPLAFALRWSRADCVAAVRAAGWPDPPKSSCWMCPHRSDAQWRDLRDHHPDDWSRAVALDEALRDEAQPHHDANAYVHRSGVALALAELHPEPGPTLFDCTTGFCFY